MMSHLRVVLLTIIIIGSLSVTPATASLGVVADRSPPVTQSGSDTVSITQTVKLTPETPGSIRVTKSVDTTHKLDRLELYAKNTAKNIDLNGFIRNDVQDSSEGFQNYEWDEHTQSPSITYDLDVNSTDSNGNYHSVDIGEWAVVSTPQMWYDGSGSRGLEIISDYKVAGPGVITSDYMFLGEHDIKTANANGQQFRLVIPEAANLSVSPDAILEDIAYASNQLKVGERDEEVVMIAIPTPNGMNWAFGGVALDRTFLTVDDAPLNSTYNVWVHEYIHTRQDFDTTRDFRWFIEGSAIYYTSLFTLQQEQIGFDRFREKTGVNRPLYENAILTKPKQNPKNPPAWNVKGDLIAGRADQRIRLATNGSASLTDIFRRLNSENEPISNADFIRYVYLYSNEEVESDIQAATTTTESMSMWDKREHKQAFGEEPHEVKAPNTETTDQESNTKDSKLEEESNTEESEGIKRFIIALVAINVIFYGVFIIYNK